MMIKRKLTDDQVVEIRKLAKTQCPGCGRRITQREIAGRFGVSNPAIYGILVGISWKHLPFDPPVDPQWLIWSNEHRSWWGPYHSGYTTVIGEAGRYPKEVADRICREANYGGQINEVAVIAPEAVLHG